MKILRDESRTRLSGSQKKMVAALEAIGWVYEVYADSDPFCLVTYWQMTKDEMWTLFIQKEKRQNLVSIGTTKGQLLLDQVNGEEFAELLKRRLEELTAVRVRLEAQAQTRS